MYETMLGICKSAALMTWTACVIIMSLYCAYTFITILASWINPKDKE